MKHTHSTWVPYSCLLCKRPMFYWGGSIHWSWFHEAEDRNMYPFCLVLETANLEIAWAKIYWIVGGCAKQSQKQAGVWSASQLEFVLFPLLPSEPSFLKQTEIFLCIYRISLCNSHLGRLLSLLILNRCGRYLSQPRYRYFTQVLRVSRPLGAKRPWEEHSLGNLGWIPRITLSGPKSTKL